MSQLEEYRKEIDRIDSELADLFCRRMETVEQIAACKREAGLAVFDPAREEAMKREMFSSLKKAELLPYYKEFLETLLALSKDYQKALGGERT